MRPDALWRTNIENMKNMQKLYGRTSALVLSSMLGGASVGYLLARSQARSRDNLQESDEDEEADSTSVPPTDDTTDDSVSSQSRADQKDGVAGMRRVDELPHSGSGGIDVTDGELEPSQSQADDVDAESSEEVDSDSDSKDSPEDTGDTVLADEPFTFRIDSLVLADCYQSIFKTPDVESIVYLTGLQVDDTTVTVNRMIELDHATQSAIKAEGHPDASFERLIQLDQTGHQLLGHCHNHPGAANGMLSPSQVDYDFQGRLEGGGYTTLGLIMSEDGYIRPYTTDLEFEVVVEGAHVEQLDDGLLYLDEEARTASKLLT